MIGICLAAVGLTAGLTASLPLQGFTLAWTHSIEKILWEEDYQVLQTADGARLQLTEARIRGSGAGMEPPPNAVLADGVWHYQPLLAPLGRLHLARSDYVADYSICWDGSCRGLADLVGPPAAAPQVEVFPCRLP
ncbi:MAG: DUF1850 domain-containing protein [Glaciimonas sp.]|nr:DUF1850 domain-containing protein [Glaciimonas sp.]